MCRKLTYLVSCFIVLAVVGSASADLVGHWKLDEESGAVAYDSSPSGWGGIVSAGAEGNWIPDGGKLGGTLDFTGQDYVIVPDFEPTDGIITVGVWAYARSRPGWSNLVTNWANETGQLHFGQNPSGLLTVHYGLSDGGTVNTSDSEAFPLEEWQHCAFVADGADVILYRNGIELARVAYDGTAKQTLPLLGIGCKPNGNLSSPAPDGGVPAYWDGFIDDVALFDHALTQDEVNKLMEGVGAKELACDPVPEDASTDVPRDVVLGWEAGEFAATHDVYFGTAFDDVNDASRNNSMGVLLSQSQTVLSYDPEGVFEYGQTYYWRVDEVNSAPDNTIFKGETWSFTVEPLAYPIANVTATSDVDPLPGAGPENMVNGSGLNENDEHSTESFDMWQISPAGEMASIEFAFDGVYKLHEMLIWNYNVQFELMLGFGLKDVTIEYSENGEDWTVLGDVVFNQATAQATYTANTIVDFGGIAVQYVKLTVNSGWGTLPVPQYGLSEVRFLHIPVQGREPQPEDGAVDVAADADLSWRAGREAVSHEAYLGADPDALELIDTTSATTVDPGALDLAMTYYWRIDEVNDAEAISTWAGATWSFSTEAYIVVDDFESYTDDIDAGEAIFLAWIDGYEANDNGSTVGHLEAPFAEQTTVRSGKQAMPLFYDNAGTSMSEAELTLAQDWSASGVQSLVLSFHGAAANTGGQLYVKINGAKIPYDGSAVNLTKATWNLWSIDLSTAGNVSDVTSLIIGVEGAGASGVVYIDDVRLYPEVLDYHKAPDVTAAGDIVQGFPNDGDWPDSESPDLAIDDDTATKYLHRKGGAETTGLQITPAMGATIITGLTLTTANDTPARDPIVFELSGSNASIDGLYTLIAAGDVVDFAGTADWPRFTKNETPIMFDNDVAYTHYQIVFPTLRSESETLMQIAEVELIGSAP